MADDAAHQVAQQSANCRLNQIMSDLPKFYSTAKKTVTKENLIDRINASIHTLAWTPEMAYNYFRMALQPSAENWIIWVHEIVEKFPPSWNFIKPLFKERFRKKIDIAKIGTVLDNLKMDRNDHVNEFAAKN
jgi:hypothetical protein